MKVTITTETEREVPTCNDCKFYNWKRTNVLGYHRCDVLQWQDEQWRPYMPITGFCSLGEFKKKEETDIDEDIDENIEIAHVSYSEAEVGREK